MPFNPKERKTKMKSWLFQGMLAAAIALPPLSGIAWAGDHVKKCSLETLEGQYLSYSNGTVFPPAFGVSAPTVSTQAGYSLYYGDGTGTDYVTFTLNGVKLPVTSPIATTYTLKPDCTGTKTVLNGPRFDIYVARDGSELTVIATAAPPNQSSGFAVSARQVRAGFDRQE